MIKFLLPEDEFARKLTVIVFVAVASYTIFQLFVGENATFAGAILLTVVLTYPVFRLWEKSPFYGTIFIWLFWFVAFIDKLQRILPPDAGQFLYAFAIASAFVFWGKFFLSMTTIDW
jgi:hypothetical protein